MSSWLVWMAIWPSAVPANQQISLSSTHHTHTLGSCPLVPYILCPRQTLIKGESKVIVLGTNNTRGCRCNEIKDQLWPDQQHHPFGVKMVVHVKQWNLIKRPSTGNDPESPGWYNNNNNKNYKDRIKYNHPPPLRKPTSIVSISFVLTVLTVWDMPGAASTSSQGLHLALHSCANYYRRMHLPEKNNQTFRTDAAKPVLLWVNFLKARQGMP